MPKKTTFSERLQRIMTERDLSQSDVARMIWGDMEAADGGARNRQVVSKYLSGEVSPRMGTKRKLAAALNMKMADLDPLSDPLTRPGSGLHVEWLGANFARLVVNLEVPRSVIDRVVPILAEYAT